MIRVTGNSAVLNATHVEITDSRFQRIYNSNSSSVANVEIGANSTAVSKTIMVGPGQVVTIDLGEMNPEFGTGTHWLSLNTNVATVYRTPVGGSS